jgi:hypothetical protein
VRVCIKRDFTDFDTDDACPKRGLHHCHCTRGDYAEQLPSGQNPWQQSRIDPHTSA